MQETIPIIPRQTLASKIREIMNTVEVDAENKSFFGVLLLDLKDFHHVNHQYGYDTGDQVLSMLLDRLRQIAKSNDHVMRTGPNEFMLVLPKISSTVLAQLAARKVLKISRQPFVFDQDNLQLMGYVGVGVVHLSENAADTVMLIAEQALMKSKLAEESFVILNDYDGSLSDDLRLRDKLSIAINAGDFEVYFQPKVRLSDLSPCGAEALIRWRDENGDFIRPDIFIPLAEKSNQIFQITNWVLNNTIRKLSALPKKWYHLSVAINLSGRCFAQENLVNDIEKIFRIWDADPHQIALEVTETVFMSDLKQTNEICEQLRKGLGVKVSIDDFGKGFSSMDYFRHIPADELKIDRCFVDGISRNLVDRNIVDCVTKLAKGSGLTVVAEGIEDLETTTVARELGCDIAQGYFFARPMPFEDFLDWLENYQPIDLNAPLIQKDA